VKNMQQAQKKNYASRLSTSKAFSKSPSLSSFSVVQRFGKLEIVSVTPVISLNEPKGQYFKIPDFPGWSMPAIPIGYIKCKQFDFL
jgi:hypothetical protein